MSAGKHLDISSSIPNNKPLPDGVSKTYDEMGTVLVLLYRHLEWFPVLGVLLGDENVDVRDRGSRLELAKLRQEYEQEITVRRVRICGPIKKCVRVLRSRRRIHRTVVPGMGEYE